MNSVVPEAHVSSNHAGTSAHLRRPLDLLWLELVSAISGVSTATRSPSRPFLSIGRWAGRIGAP